MCSRNVFLAVLMLCCLTFATPAAVASQQEPLQHLLMRAHQVYQRGVYDSALFLYQTVAQRCLYANAPRHHMAACTGIGNVFMKRRDYDHATLYLDSARSMAVRTGTDSQEGADAFYASGVLYDFINQPEQAIQFHKEALSMRRRLLGEYHVQVAECYNGLGEVYRYTLRDYASAEQNFQHAVEILTRTATIDFKQLYRSYYNLATTNRLKNDFEKASGYAFKAIDALERMRPTDTPALIRCYGMLANIYNNQGAFEKAVVYYRKAIGLRRANGTLYTSETANDYRNLSIAYTDSRRIPSALICIDSARHILMARNAYDSGEIANVLTIRGKALHAAGQYEQALLQFRQALTILERYTDANPLDITNVCQHMSGVLEEQGKYRDALLYLQQGICVAAGESIPEKEDMRNPSFERLRNIPQCYRELSQKGELLMKLAAEHGQPYTYWRLALECFKLADKLMDLHWESQDRETSRLRFVGINYTIYEHALACAYHLYGRTGDARYIGEAFTLIDKSKGRILRARLEEVGRQLQRQIPDSTMQQERTIRHAIATLQKRLSHQDLSDSLERVTNTALVAEEEKLRFWQERVSAKFPGAVVVDQPTRRLELSLLKSKLGNNAVFVEYFTGKTFIYAVVVFNGREHLLRMPIGSTEEDVRTLGELLAAGVRQKLLHDDYAVYTRLASQLGEMLLAPVFRTCNLKTHAALPPMLIVPDGILNLLPFQALLLTSPSGEGEVDYRRLDYVVRHTSVSYSYDAASLFAPSAERSHRGNLLAYGWSDGTEQATSAAGNLPGAHRELEAIASMMPGTFVSGKAAGKRSFLEQAPDYAMLHLALHGKADALDIYNCYLQFQDEKLYAHELYSLRLTADLTVLSACETGYGKSFQAEGVYSVARGFFQAGARNVVMSLWRIDDGTTASLMQKFYGRLEQETISNALALAQRGYLKEADQYTAHPAYWAGMVSWGDTHKITPGEGDPLLHSMVIGMILLAILGTLLLTWKKIRSRVTIPGLPTPAVKYLEENV